MCLAIWLQVGGSQKEVSSGSACFQLLRMENGMPKASKRSTLEQFLGRRSWPCAVAAVGLPAYPRGSAAAPSLCKLHDCMMEVRLEKVGGLDHSHCGIHLCEVLLLSQDLATSEQPIASPFCS